ncbi:MAG: DUF58 domain-containing protein [Armatimonadota bacterium]
MLTREGTATLLLAIAVFLLATNLMSGLLFALDAVLVSLFIVGTASAYGPVRRMRATRRVQPRAIEGDAVVVDTTLASRRGARFVTVEEGWRGTRARAIVPHVKPGVPVTAAVTLVPKRRGQYALEATEIASRGTVGLFAARRRLPGRDHLTVWPRPQPVHPGVLAGLLSTSEVPVAVGDRTRAAEDFYGVRDYQRGDAPSRIHWRLSMRRGALVVREYERPRAERFAIVVDLDRRQSRERLDAAVRAAASILQAALDRGADVVTAAWNGEYIEHHGFESTMGWLAGVEPSGPPLVDVLRVLPALLDRRLIVFASSTALPPLPPNATAVVPADDNPGRGVLMYASDGTVQVW